MPSDATTTQPLKAARRATGCTLLLLTALAAPVDARAQAPASLMRDSSGVRIIENARPGWAPGKAWTLSASPLLEIGPAGGPEYVFSRIASATRLRDGRIVVAERAALQLRFFSATGRHLRTVGEKGQGPGEFSDIGTMTRLPGDSLAVESLRYTSIFAPDGQFVRQVRYGPFAPGLLQVPFVAVLGRFPDGSAVVGDFPQGRHAARGAARWVDSSTLLLVDPTGAVVKDAGRVPAIAFAPGVNAPVPLNLGPELVHASAAGHVYLGFGDQYAIHEYDPSFTLRRMIRRAWTPRPLSSDDLNTYVDAWMTLWSKETGAKRERERLGQINAPYPEVLPAFSDLLASDNGELWLRDPDLSAAPGCMCLSGVSDRPSAWSVFAADGRWLGEVTMPPRFTPAEVGRDYVLGQQRDAANGVRVVMYRLVK